MRLDPSSKNPYDELDRFDEDDLMVDEVSDYERVQPLTRSPEYPSPATSRVNAAPVLAPPAVTTPQPTTQVPAQPTSEVIGPSGAPGQYIVNPADGSTIFVPMPPKPKDWWEKQPYVAIAYTATVSGILTLAWLFGILVAQVLPGNITKPPIQETVLRKSSRLASRLWNFRQLWHTPTAETRIEAIPLPNTEPVTEPLQLSPIERQPFIDELNAIETEILTLDRRIATLEKQLGRPPYKGADIDNRVNSLRAVIDPPVRSSVEPDYKPTPSDPNDTLLDVAKLRITLPSDALFTPGQSDLKENPLLNQVLDQLVNYPDSTVIVLSYSDDQADALASRQYTLAQADELSHYLKASLPKGYRWVVFGSGRSQPIASNEDELGRQKNRRIEILVDTR